MPSLPCHGLEHTGGARFDLGNGGELGALAGVAASLGKHTVHACGRELTDIGPPNTRGVVQLVAHGSF